MQNLTKVTVTAPSDIYKRERERERLNMSLHVCACLCVHVCAALLIYEKQKQQTIRCQNNYRADIAATCN